MSTGNAGASRRLTGLLLGVAVMTGLMVSVTVVQPGSAAAAGPRPAFQLPFPCGQQWWLESYASIHAPALDMVKEPDQHGTEGALLIAPAPGRVDRSFLHQNAGNLIQIDHGGGWFTTYAHLESRSVQQGTLVSTGQEIGRVGRTGETSNGHPHLHFELAIDANGDGHASWGAPGSERVPPWFDGIEYGQNPGQVWRNVTSRNCGGGGPGNVGTGVVARDNNHLNMFTRGTDGGIWHLYWSGQAGWGAWQNLGGGGGTLVGDPDVAAMSSGHLNVFVRGSNGGLWHLYWTSTGGWYPWQYLGAPPNGPLTSSPTVVSRAPGVLDVFARGADGGLVHRGWSNQTGWGAWENLGGGGGTLVGDPDVAAMSGGHLNVFLRGSNGGLWHLYWTSTGGWYPWQYLGAPPNGALSSGPSVVARATGVLDVFARGADGGLLHRGWWGPTGWGAWENLGGGGGTLVGDPDVAALDSGHLNVFLRGSNGGLWHLYWTDTGGWYPWQYLASM